VRIITGSDDPLAADAAEMLAALPQVDLVTLRGAGHHPQLTHGADLVRLLTAQPEVPLGGAPTGGRPAGEGRA
jgi:pimeloyl-ACP methyl ester carboxylesterase